MTDSDKSGDHDHPKWVRSLSAALERVGSQPGKRGTTHRESAVLVLLTDGPDGVHVLLTERALELRQYPGQVTFPGGKKDPIDADLTATALREAREEVGLDPASVQILGSLPTTVAPGGKTTVTPVLAWSACPKFPGTVNAAEVAAVHQLSIRDLPAAGGSEQPPAESAEVISKLGEMTADILDAVAALLRNLKTNDAKGIHGDE